MPGQQQQAEMDVKCTVPEQETLVSFLIYYVLTRDVALFFPLHRHGLIQGRCSSVHVNVFGVRWSMVLLLGAMSIQGKYQIEHSNSKQAIIKLI